MKTAEQLWIGTSWKMNKTLPEAIAFVDGLIADPPDPRIRRFVIPPFTAARKVKGRLRKTDILVGAQNMHWAEDGAWTGEISAPMLVDCGLDMVELGHSERRTHFGETDETVGLKTEAAIRHGLLPLICIGESADEKAAGRAEAVLRRQIEGALGHLTDAQRAAPILLAYEPVWAIGAGGTPASPDHAERMHAAIVGICRTIIGRDLPCLYGGSVNPENCADLITRPHVDGLFIGRAAWNVAGYRDILARCATALGQETRP